MNARLNNFTALKTMLLNMFNAFLENNMFYGLKNNTLAKMDVFIKFFCFCWSTKSDNDRSQFLPKDVFVYLFQDFSNHSYLS